MKIASISTLYGLLMLLSLAFCGCRQGYTPPAPAGPSKTAEMVAQQVVTCLKAKDFVGLQPFIIADKGVRFTPYAYVDVKKDKLLNAEQLAKAWADGAKYDWGSYDGTGDPINLTFAEYYAKFIYDKDYATATQQGAGKRLGKSNSIDNSAATYPGCTVYEFYSVDIDATEETRPFAWGSLRLVLTEYQPGDWRLIGIIHDQWTI